MVFHASDFMHENLLLFANTGQIGPQAGLRIVGNQLTPVLGAEHNMDGIVNVRVGHVPRLHHPSKPKPGLPGTPASSARNHTAHMPTAMPWATFWSRLRRLVVSLDQGPGCPQAINGHASGMVGAPYRRLMS